MAGDPDADFAVGMLTVGVMSHVFDDDALRKVVFIKYYARESEALARARMSDDDRVCGVDIRLLS